MSKAKHSQGFTLLEILLVVAAIALLAGITITAINPSKQLTDTQNVLRSTDVRSINTAIEAYKIDNKGISPDGLTANWRMIGTDSSGCNVQCGEDILLTSSCLDIEEEIEEYLVTLPYDPELGNTQKTYYATRQNTNGRVETISCYLAAQTESLAQQFFDGINLPASPTQTYSGNSSADYNGSSIDDYIYYTLNQQSAAEVNLFAGNDTVYVERNARGITNLYEGNDQFYTNRSLTGTLTMGDGKDIFYGERNVTGTIDTGDGSDQLYCNRQFRGTINTGAGNDTIISARHFNGDINLGEGNDYAETGQNIKKTIDGGDGYDIIKFGSSNVESNWSGFKQYVDNFEKVIFYNGTEWDIDPFGERLADGANNYLLP